MEKIESLNPYYSGIYTSTLGKYNLVATYKNVLILIILEYTLLLLSLFITKSNWLVLILIILEYTLLQRKMNLLNLYQYSLNPYYSGIYTSTLLFKLQ